MYLPIQLLAAHSLSWLVFQSQGTHHPQDTDTGDQIPGNQNRCLTKPNKWQIYNPGCRMCMEEEEGKEQKTDGYYG